MSKGLRIALALLAIAASGPIFLWLFSEAVVVYEMTSTGAASRAELGDDLGLGILLFIVALPATAIATVLFGFVVWSWTGSQGKHEGA